MMMRKARLAEKNEERLSRLAKDYYRRGEYRAAQLCAQKLIAKNPRCISALEILLMGSIRKGDQARIETYLAKLVAEDSSSFDYAAIVAAIHSSAVPLADLAELVRQATLRAHNHSAGFFLLGVVSSMAHRHPEAVTALKAAVSLDPTVAGYREKLSASLVSIGDLAGAQTQLQTVIHCHPFDVSLRFNHVRLSHIRGRSDDAETGYRAVLALDPTHPKAANNLGTLLREKGCHDEAKDWFARACRSERFEPEAFYNLSQIESARENPSIIDPVVRALRLDKLRDDQKAIIRFAAGKVFEDIGDYPVAFEHYSEGARLKRATFDYDVGSDVAAMRALARAGVVERGSIESDCWSKVTPIFIVGMPRSGTTLVEQILSAHSAVTALGERDELRNAIHVSRGNSKFLEWLRTLEGDDITKFKGLYYGALGLDTTKPIVFTDKMPANFRFVGVIASFLREARIVHVIRDPRDTSVSCFVTLFTNGQKFSYNLDDISEYYIAYRKLTDYWKKTPASPAILEVNYEELVNDCRHIVSRILKHCGLEWEESCLHFHKSRRVVKTASVDQVRRPLYRSSVGRWRRFEAFLEPLRTKFEQNGLL